MKAKNLIILLMLSLIIISCGTSTGIEKIKTVTVNDSYEVELSHPVKLPISKSDAIIIMEECCQEYNSSMGEPELIDDVWSFYWGPEYPVFGVTVNRKDGAVTVSLFG
jgi:hypothetical protein